MRDRDLIDDPWRIALLGAAFIAAVFLPTHFHQWPLLGLGSVIALGGTYLGWRRHRRK